MFKSFAIILGIMLMLSTGAAFAQDQSKEKAAIAAATSWLALVDAGKYGESYDQAAQLFKNALTKQKWEQSLTVARKPFGNLISRKVKSASYHTSLPGAPDGQYVVIQFSTSFTHKKNAIETVTPMLDSDKKWHVSGYYIK